MTTLGTLVKGHGLTVAPLPFDPARIMLEITAAVGRANLTAGAAPLDLGNGQAIIAAVIGWVHQDDDAHEPCSLVACRAPLHPGPCKGWKGTLAKVAPGTYKQLETERVAKANARRVKKIADLKAQGKPIPRRLLAEIKAKPDPNAGVGGATATPLSKVNQQADLAGGQAHTTSQAINQAAGVKPNLPLGPKQKKPTVAGRGPAFVITQPKVTDHYKLGKAEALTAADWAALTPADKKAIRDELEAIKVRGFGPQQARATTLLAKLPAASTLGTSATPNAPAAPQAPPAAPGRTTLGKATKTVPTTTGRGAAAAAPAADDAARKAADGTASTADILSAVDKVGPGALNPVQRDVIGARLKFIANHPKATDAQKKAARAQMARLGVDGGTPAAPAGATPPPVAPAKPTLPSPGPSAAPSAAKPTLPSPGPTPAGPTTGATQAASALAITEAAFGPQVTDQKKLADGFAQMQAQGGGDIRKSHNFKLLVDRLANKALQKASAANMPGLGHGANDDNITTFNKQISDHIADGKPGLPPVMQRLKNHLDAQKAGTSTAPAGPATPQPNAPAVAKATPTSAPSGATPAPVAASKPTLPSPGPAPAKTPAPALPSPSNGPAPQAPAAPSNTPKAFPPNVQTARAVAGRAVGTRATSKAHMDAYGTLSKADFDSLDQATQRTIRDDLANASAKFLDPAKKQAAKDLLARFGSRHTSPAPGAPNVPAHPKGYSDPQQQAVKAATSGMTVTDDVLKTVARLTPDQVNKLDGPDKQAILTRLAFIATHPKATDQQKAEAAAYGRIINGGSYVPPGKTWDHTPSLGELNREEQTGGHAAVFAARVATQDKTMDKADRLKALSTLTKAQFDLLSATEKRDLLDVLQELHSDRIMNGGKLDVDAAVEKAFDTYVGVHPAVDRMTQVEADWKSGKLTSDQVHTAFLRARVQANGANNQAARAAVEAAGARMARDNPGMPMWLRATLVGEPKYGGPTYRAAQMAQSKFNWEKAPRLSKSDFDDLFRADDAALNGIEPIHAQAIRDLRASVLKTGLDFASPWSTATKDQAINAFLGTNVGRAGSITGPEVSAERVAAFKKLPPATASAIVTHLKNRLRTQTNNNAKTETYITLRELEGLPPMQGAFRDAMLEATEGYAAGAKQDIYRRLDPVDFQSMPTYTRDAIKEHLDKFNTYALRSGATHRWQPTDNALKVMPKALAAHLDGSRPSGLNRDERNASDFALYGTGIIAPEDRVAAYNKLTPTQLGNLPPRISRAVFDDLNQIENNATIPLQTRYDAAMSSHVGLKTNSGITFNTDQLSAVQAANLNPKSSYSDVAALSAFNDLSKADFDSLPPTFRAAIDARLAAMPGPAQQIITAKLHPAPTPAVANLPSGTVPTGTQAPVSPRVQTALDVIYGTNPKAHTMAAQLSAYGGLTGSDFNSFNVQEQQQLLSDLSFIATTAKGPSATKAAKLIDRFTPPGTPSGQLPANPAVIPPANSVPGQVRYATPQVGTLVMAKDKGKGGDGWVSTPGGKRVWGKYGAAGLLLRHVDPGTGEKRYLMVQRGPGISDPGKWQFPGGAIDEKETFHQGGAREVIEELGFKPDDLKTAGVVGEHTSTIPGSSWKYVSIAADVPSMLKPDLSSHHAQMETSDAKWMTEAEIRALDTSGKLLAPLAGGKLEQNVISLFPQTAASGTGKLGQVARPGPVTKRPKRMTMPFGGRQSPANFNAWPHAHKPSTGKNLIPDKAALDAQRQRIKTERKLYDGKTADGRLAAIGAQQGFDAMPTVLDRKEIDRLLATGDYIEAWRGVSGAGGWSARSRGGSGGKTAADINEEMRSGPAYYGKGIFGNGYYLATNKSVARQYSDGSHGSIVRILIPKSAVMKKYDEVEREASSRSSRTSKAKGAGYSETSTFWDPGRYAAGIGVDGIEINPHHRSPGGGASHVASPGKPAFNWLNRSVLILQKEPG